MSTKIYGVGIRGAGQVAIQHVAAIAANPYTRVVAVCSRKLESGAEFARLYAPGAKVYEHYEDMLADPNIDIVSECMPNYLHASEGIAALAAGKHLILEKPAGITQEESDRLFEAAQKSDGQTVVSFVLRWHPLVRNLKRLLDRNAFGDLYYVCADYWHGIKPGFSSYNWIRKSEFAGGAMITGGSHAADIARYLGGEVEEVSAYSLKKRDDFDYDTTFVAAVRFSGGKVGKISASLDGLAFPYQFNIDLLGTLGAARDNRIYTKELLDNQSDWMTMACDTPNSGSVAHHPFQAEIDNFVAAIRRDTPVLCPLEEACRSMDVVFAINESARTGRPVSVKKR
jgi:UDP-N-acetylglucosamine 3-dehydrogenase